MIELMKPTLYVALMAVQLVGVHMGICLIGTLNSEYALLINNIAWRFIKTGRHYNIDREFHDIDGDKSGVNRKLKR
jgi:hypothetical protein